MSLSCQSSSSRKDACRHRSYVRHIRHEPFKHLWEIQVVSEVHHRFYVTCLLHTWHAVTLNGSCHTCEWGISDVYMRSHVYLRHVCTRHMSYMCITRITHCVSTQHVTWLIHICIHVYVWMRRHVTWDCIFFGIRVNVTHCIRPK